MFGGLFFNHVVIPTVSSDPQLMVSIILLWWLYTTQLNSCILNGSMCHSFHSFPEVALCYAKSATHLKALQLPCDQFNLCKTALYVSLVSGREYGTAGRILHADFNDAQRSSSLYARLSSYGLGYKSCFTDVTSLVLPEVVRLLLLSSSRTLLWDFRIADDCRRLCSEKTRPRIPLKFVSGDLWHKIRGVLSRKTPCESCPCHTDRDLPQVAIFNHVAWPSFCLWFIVPSLSIYCLVKIESPSLGSGEWQRNLPQPAGGKGMPCRL